MTGFNLSDAAAGFSQASVTQSAGGAGVVNIATLLSFATSATGGGNTAFTIELRDGVSGAGAILWQSNITVANNTLGPVQRTIPLRIIGSDNTAMTLEFSAATGASVQFQSVYLEGVTY